MTSSISRHFRLTPLELSYYVSHPGLDPKATRKGVIQLARIRKVMQISNDQFKRANVFCISYANWHLYAEAASSAEVYDWVERIKKAAYAARKMNKFLAFDDAWFVGTLSDVEVKTQLETAQSGDFLVRQSPRKPTDFCLHIKKGARGTTSCPIDERDGFFQIRSNRTRDTLVKQACDLRFKTLAQMIKASVEIPPSQPRICSRTLVGCSDPPSPPPPVISVLSGRQPATSCLC